MQSTVKSTRVAGVLLLLILLTATGVAVGYGVATTLPQAAAKTNTVTKTVTSTTTNASAPYEVTLVITTENIYNSTVGDQPAYYVLGPNGLESSANISLPANRLIRMVIVNYDDGPADLAGPQYAQVSGTQNNVVTQVSNDLMNSSQGASGIQIKGVNTTSAVAPNDIAHTFTVPQLGLNIPIMPSSTVTAYFTINQTGTFLWFCETMCGSGPNGDQGAMSTPGWMTGSVSVG